MSDTKFCKDCRFCDASDGGLKYATCEAPLNRTTKTNLVTGEVEKTYARFKYCAAIRAPGLTDCGPDAKWFEPREPEQVAA